MASKLKPSTNHVNRKRSFDGARYNFHTTITNEEQTEIVEAISSDNKIQESSIHNIEHHEVKSIGILAPQKTIDIPLEQLEEAPKEWNYFPLPNLEILKDIAKSIYTQGQLSPALVWETDDNKYMILGGHTRFKIISFLREAYPEESDRFSTMKCHVYGKDQIGESEAQYLIITNNMTQRARESTSIMVKSIVKALELQKSINHRVWGEKKERSSELVAKNFGIAARSVDRLYRLRTLIPELMDLLDRGDMVQNAAIRVASMTEDTQKMYLDSECFIYSMNAEQESRIRKAESAEEIKEIYNKTRYSFVPKKVYLDYEIPRQFEKLSIAVSKNDLDIVKKALLDVSDKISPESQKILLDLLK